MRHRPDDTGLPAWFGDLERDAVAVTRSHTAFIATESAASAVPLLAWPLIEAVRRSHQPPPAATLATLGRLLDAWEGRFGLAGGARGPVSVAAQTWLVQDLHCLADLHNHFGDGDGSAWSARGHRAEELVHRRLWRDGAYGDLDAGGAWRPASTWDALMPLLLLDTPAERVDLLVAGARAAGGDPAASGRWLIDEGLRRHRRPAE